MLRNLESIFLELCLLELHLNQCLIFVLLFECDRVKEECPWLVSNPDGVRWLLMEVCQVIENGIEIIDTDLIFTDSHDARPELILKALLVLRSLYLTAELI